MTGIITTVAGIGFHDFNSDMAIHHYSFGKIKVDGKTYEHDILIYPDKTVKYWKAEINHVIQLSDIKSIIDESTTTLIIGIGATKMCEVDQDLMDYAGSKGIRLHMLNTYDAVKLFNKTSKKGLSACFHVNC